MHRNLYISNFEVIEMMWKEIGSIVKKLILLLFPFFLLLPLYCMLFRKTIWMGSMRCTDSSRIMCRAKQVLLQGY